MKDSCYFNQPVQDMGATIPCCDLFKELGFCPCENPSFQCPFYIHYSSVRSIVIKYIFSNRYPDSSL